MHHPRPVQYAAYGSNLHPARLTQRVPSAELLGACRLPGWSLCFHKKSNVDGSGKCSIISSGESIHVAIYSLHLPEKALLDEIEGVGQGYDELIVDVPRFGECFTYVASRAHVQDDLVPLDWYKEMVVLGCERNNFPDDYVDEIRAVPAAMDPDRRRSFEQWNIVEQIRAGAGCQRPPL